MLAYRDQSPKNQSAFTPQSCTWEIEVYFHCVFLCLPGHMGGSMKISQNGEEIVR